MSSRRKKQPASASRANTRSSARLKKKMLAEMTNIADVSPVAAVEEPSSKPAVDIVKPRVSPPQTVEVVVVAPTTAPASTSIPRSSPSFMETVANKFSSGVAMVTSLLSPNNKTAGSKPAEPTKADEKQTEELVASMKALTITPATTTVPQQSPPATAMINDALAAKLRRDSFGIRDLVGMDLESDLKADDDGHTPVSSDSMMSEEPSKPRTPNVSDRRGPKKRLSASGVLFSTSPVSNASDDSFQQETDHEGCPEPYITFNPAMLSDKEKWTHRDLQKVAVKLGVHAGGKREEIIDRLLKWHKEKQDEELNVPASNFALWSVDVDRFIKSDKKKKSVKKTEEKLPKPKKFSPSHLTPLVKRPRLVDGTPVGILSPPISERKSAAKKQLSFSVFNGVKIIPARDRSNSTPGRIQTDQQQSSGQENDNSNNAVSVPETHEEGDEGSVQSPPEEKQRPEEEEESSPQQDEDEEEDTSPAQDAAMEDEEEGQGQQEEEEKQHEPQSLATKRLSFDEDEDEEENDVEAEMEEKKQQENKKPLQTRPASPANTPMVAAPSVTKPVPSKPAAPATTATSVSGSTNSNPTANTVTSANKFSLGATAANSTQPIPQSSLPELVAAYRKHMQEHEPTRVSAALSVSVGGPSLIASKPAILSSSSSAVASKSASMSMDTSSSSNKPSAMSLQLNGNPMPMPSQSMGMVQQAFGGGSARAAQIAPAASGNKFATKRR